MAVSKRTRHEVMRRDNYTCRYCRANDKPLTIDHVTPIALGGTDDPDNLVAACRDCNYGKASSAPDATMVADVKGVELRWSAAMKQAAENLAVEHTAEQQYIEQWGAAWATWTWNRAPSDAESSVARLYRAGLPVDVMVNAVEITGCAYGVQNRFSYFMGICWKKVTALQETARQILEAEMADGAGDA